MKFYCSFLFVLVSGIIYSQGFKKLSAKSSGIEFINQIFEDDTINGLSYLYLYNGGGVAIGDINNDGLEDVYFTGNQVPDKLYLNLGNMKFKDVTKKYFKVQENGFHTGVTMVDINNDGWLDIYVSCAGPAYSGDKKRNKLFINQSGKKFLNQAKEFGLDDPLNSTQAAFFDADNDGDLDAYILNHVYLRKNTQYRFQFNQMKKVQGYDRLMINENGFFSDKTAASGIYSAGYGQGVVVSDFNQDGLNDIYVTNDFEDADKLFMNTGNGKFKEQIRDKTMHIPLFSMGVDAADFNNDGLVDLMAVDMVSEDHVKSKKNMGGMSSENFWKLVENKQHYQYMFNALQLNLGESFIDVGQFAGVSKTDWSWSPLFADFDNDGYQDLYVSNGYFRSLRDNDFTAAYDTVIQISHDFIPFDELKKMIPQSKSPNYIFKNDANLQFTKKSYEWGLEEAINVNGAAYADLDNDGDLDLVCNASNEKSFILENTQSENNYLKVKVTGNASNSFAVGSRIELYTDTLMQVREIQPTRGFQSGVSHTVHFGLNQNETIDSVLVRVNGNVVSRSTEVKVNQTIKLNVESADKITERAYLTKTVVLELAQIDGLNFRHSEIAYNDFQKEILLPNKMSQLGPFINVDDLNQDGKDDIYFGAARGSKGSLLIQNDQGSFEEKSLEIFKTNFLSEEMETVFFDADNDGDLDVYIAMGSNEADVNHSSYYDELYLNDGNLNFVNASDSLPKIACSGQKVIAQDLNADGWIDLVVFGRQIPGQYPAPASSYILINRKGKFVNETDRLAPGFENLGMVTDALFFNLDADKELELIVVGEWMPVTIFDFENGTYNNITEAKGLANTVGWWNTIECFDDKNGQQQFMLGNLGLNNKFHPSVERPLHVYMSDFDDNGTNDIVLAKEEDAILYPVRGLQCSAEQMPFIAKKFDTYEKFAFADLQAIYSDEKLNQALHYEAHTFANSVLTVEAGAFKIEPLPNAYQTGPINSFIIDDFNEDGYIDMFCFGNKFEAEVETIRYDGNPSLFYNGAESIDQPLMLNIIKNIKSAELIKNKGKHYIIIGINDQAAEVYQINKY